MSGFSPRTDPYPIESGGEPGWPAGYVPPAAEWNHWWSHKADVDDPRITGGPFLPLTGGTMTGTLVLAGMPLGVNDAATKAYVDQFTPVAGPFLSQSGGTMTGPLILSADPAVPLEAATRQYVDGVGTTAGTALAVAQAAVPRTGATMTGPLILSANPTQALGAATKQYVDGFLPLYGGTVTGSVTVNGDVNANILYGRNGLHPDDFNGWEWTLAADANGSKYQTYRAGWYDAWDGTTGMRSWVTPGGSMMSLSGSGVLNVVSTVNAGNFNTGGGGTFGAVAVSGTLTANYVSANTIVSNGNINAAGTYGGNAMSLSGNVVCLDVYARSATLSDRLQAQNAVISSGTLNVAGISSLGGGGAVYSAVDTHSFSFWYYGPGGTVFARLDGVTDVTIGVISDEHRKTDIKPSEFDALAAIRRVPLYSFNWKEADNLPEHAKPREPYEPIGFVAQRLAETFPEAAIDTGTSVTINSNVVLAALVASVQTLATKLDNLTQPAMKA